MRDFRAEILSLRQRCRKKRGTLYWSWNLSVRARSISKQQDSLSGRVCVWCNYSISESSTNAQLRKRHLPTGLLTFWWKERQPLNIDPIFLRLCVSRQKLCMDLLLRRYVRDRPLFVADVAGNGRFQRGKLVWLGPAGGYYYYYPLGNLNV